MSVSETSTFNHLIYMPHYDDQQYEPSREMKQRFLATRKHDPTIGATPHPGLFQTANVAGDTFGLLLALLLETYGLANLMRIGSIEITAALALVAVDILGALLSHFRQGNLCRISALLAVTDDPSERARIRHRNSLRDRGIRGLGSLMIAGSAAWKIVSFSSIGSLNETPAAIVALMALVYISAAFLHWRCTGYAIAHAWLAIGLELERRRTLGEVPATAKCGIHGLRQHPFESRLPLVECTVNGHVLTVLRGSRYVLRTTGLLFDHDLATLAARQDCPEARDFVSREGLRAQLAMLDQEPVRPSITTDSKCTEDEGPEEPQASGNGGVRRTTSFARHAALLILSAVIAGGFTGCGNPPQPKRSVEMVVAVPVASLTEDHKLPEEVIDLLAPAKLPVGSANIPAVVPTVTVVVVGGADYARVTVKPKVDPGFVARSYGVTAPANRLLANLREQLRALKLEPVAATANGSTEPQAATTVSIENLVFDSAGKPQGTVLIFEPDAREPHPVKIGTAEVPAFSDSALIDRAVADAVAEGESKFTLLYSVNDLLAPSANATAQVKIAEKPAVQKEAQPVEKPSKPRIVELNGDFNHTALVNEAELELVMFFKSESADLSFDSIKGIEHLAKKASGMNAATGQWIVVGYADESGDRTGNNRLSLERALRVAEEMNSLGINVAIVAGAGSTRPVATNDTTAGREANRRVAVYYTRKLLTAVK